jgi:hypothetical protein
MKCRGVLFREAAKHSKLLILADRNASFHSYGLFIFTILFTWNLKAKFMFKSQFWMVELLSSTFLRPGRTFHLNPTVHG